MTRHQRCGRRRRGRGAPKSSEEEDGPTVRGLPSTSLSPRVAAVKPLCKVLPPNRSHVSTCVATGCDPERTSPLPEVFTTL